MYKILKNIELENISFIFKRYIIYIVSVQKRQFHAELSCIQTA